jgi:hypothetical protein
MPLTLLQNRDCREVVADWQFPRMENRAARYAELLSAILAAPDRPRAIAVHFDVSAMWAIGLPVVVRPPDLNEFRVRFLRRQPENLSEGQTPCGCGEKEMLRHDPLPSKALLTC